MVHPKKFLKRTQKFKNYSEMFRLTTLDFSQIVPVKNWNESTFGKSWQLVTESCSH